MGTLEQGEPIDSMRFIREDLEATAYASYIVEIVDRLTEDNERSMGSLIFCTKHFMPSMSNMIRKQLHFLWSGRCFRSLVFIQFFMNVRIAMRQKGNLLFLSEKSVSFAIVVFILIDILFELLRHQLKLIRTFYTVPINRVGNLTLKKKRNIYEKNCSYSL